LPDKIDYLLQPVLARPTQREPLSESEKAAWHELISQQLASWSRDPEQLGDDGVVAPTVGIIALAIDTARALRDQRVESPDRVVPNGDGGIVFRWRSGDLTWSLELDTDGSMETSLVDRDSLVCRHSLHAEASH
jgi:hypothetical protein